MSNSIQIEVTGTDLEIIAITLSDKEVKAIYEQNKSLKEEVKNLNKEVETQKSNYKWASESRDKVTSEVSQANTLLTALGVQLQTNEEESYRRTELPVATRIALYIATNK
jgi:chromosome segregation ATPase